MTSNLKPLLDAHVQVLRDDVNVRAFVDFDDENEIKVYDYMAKTNSRPPFVVVTMIPTLSDQTGVYGDDDVMKITYFQVTCWGVGRNDSLRLMDICNEALLIGDWGVAPWELMKVRMEGMPQPIADRDTDWIGVQSRYRAMFGR